MTQATRVPKWLKILIFLPDRNGSSGYWREFDDASRGVIENTSNSHRGGKYRPTAEHSKFYDLPDTIIRQIIKVAEAEVPADYKAWYMREIAPRDESARYSAAAECTARVLQAEEGYSVKLHLYREGWSVDSTFIF